MLKALFATVAQIAAAERIRGAIARGVAAGVCLLLALWLAAVALLCALAALWIFLLPHVGPVYAPLIVSGLLLTVSLLMLLAARRVTHRPQRVPSGIAPLAALIADAERMLRENKSEVLLAAIIAGLVAGGSTRRK